MAAKIDSGPTVGSRHKLFFTISANVSPFTIVGSTIKAYLKDPGGDVSSAHDVSANISGETVYYETDDSASPDLDEAGDWFVGLDIVISGRHFPTQWLPFEVFEGPPTT